MIVQRDPVDPAAGRAREHALPPRRARRSRGSAVVVKIVEIRR
jgi:hypothetical protein